MYSYAFTSGYGDSAKRQNLNQGVYMALTKYFEKVPSGDEEKEKGVKKNLWLGKLVEHEATGEKRRSASVSDEGHSPKRSVSSHSAENA